ncbi:MAG: (2Fe-2S) ferredoxin domain-containing protein [Christensenellales bacterium]|jgi:NADP-reducing hydrogenase subunit HndB
MKTLADLEAIRKRTLDNLNTRKDEHATRVVVGMATCGIAAGARKVMAAFIDEVAKRNLQHVTIAQTGCIGLCRLEPIVEIAKADEEKVTYCKVTPEIAREIVASHLVNGIVLHQYTIGHYENS